MLLLREPTDELGVAFLPQDPDTLRVHKPVIAEEGFTNPHQQWTSETPGHAEGAGEALVGRRWLLWQYLAGSMGVQQPMRCYSGWTPSSKGMGSKEGVGQTQEDMKQ